MPATTRICTRAFHSWRPARGRVSPTRGRRRCSMAPSHDGAAEFIRRRCAAGAVDDAVRLPYQPDLIAAEEEAALLAWIATLHLTPYEFQGYLANRNVGAFGYRYSYQSRRMESAPALPPLLLALREKVAAFAGRAAEDFKQVLVTEYAPGVALGWHRDRPQYGEIVGVSLLSDCHFKLRRRARPTSWPARRARIGSTACRRPARGVIR